MKLFTNRPFGSNSYGLQENLHNSSSYTGRIPLMKIKVSKDLLDHVMRVLRLQCIENTALHVSYIAETVHIQDSTIIIVI